MPILKNMNRIEAVAGITAIALLVIGCLVVLKPFVSAILWATVLAYTTWPLMIRLERRTKGRRTLAALTMTILVALVMVLPFAVAGITLAENVSRLQNLIPLMQGQLPATPPRWIAGLPWAGPLLERSWPDIVLNTGTLSNMLKSAGLAGGKWLLRHGIGFGKGILQLSLSVLIMFVFLRDGERLTARVAAGGQRILGDDSQRLLTVAGTTIRSVVYGIIGSALAQAIAATIGFLVAGVPSPFLLGFVTFILAMIPAGPPFVWVPATAWLFYSGQTGWGIFMIVWGVFAISGVDNFVRPYLVSRGSNLPFIVVMLGALGGVLAFGFIGIFLGPVLLGVGYVLAREFTTERRTQRRKPPAAEPGTPSGGAEPSPGPRLT